MNFKVSADEASIKLLNEQSSSGKPFAVIMNHGSMSIEYFAPKEVDTQTPHKQHEIYIIEKGHGNFFRNGGMPASERGKIAASGVDQGRRIQRDQCCP